MIYSSEPFEMPCGLEVAAKAVDYAVAHDKTPPVNIYSCGDGHPMVTFYNRDGSKKVTSLFGDGWYEGRIVDG